MRIPMGGRPLSAENQTKFDRIWEWFVAHGLTRKEKPTVASGSGSYHLEVEEFDLIGINEDHDDTNFPLEAVMLEEILHCVSTGDDPGLSSDYSPQFLQFILGVIIRLLHEREQKRLFQSALIRRLWDLLEPECRGE